MSGQDAEYRAAPLLQKSPDRDFPSACLRATVPVLRSVTPCRSAPGTKSRTISLSPV